MWVEIKFKTRKEISVKVADLLLKAVSKILKR